jgi:hypothetical protein
MQSPNTQDSLLAQQHRPVEKQKMRYRGDDAEPAMAVVRSKAV